MIERLTHEEQCTRFRDACKWLQSMGLRLNLSRVEQYLTDLDDLAKAVREGNGLQFEKERGQANIINTVLEATECIDIHSGMKNYDSTALPELLRDFISGTALRSSEQAGNSRP